MSLEPLLNASLPIKIHVFTVVPAFVLGTWLIFFSRKGARNHRAVGFVYLALMTITAIAALFIHTIMPNGPFFGFSPIHIFSILTLSGVVSALYHAKKHNIPRHKRAMLGVYIGGLLIAGAFTFLPGRIVHQIFFGG
jgi:uncharacterized membrane protein